MGFFQHGLYGEAYDRNYGDWVLVRRILHYFRPAARLMIGAAVAVVLGSIMDTVMPVLLARGIDTMAVTHSLHAVGLLVGAVLVAGALSWLGSYARQVFTSRAVGDVVLQLRRDAFDAVMARDMSFFDEFPSAKIVSRVTSDTDAFTTVVTLVLSLIGQILLLVLIAGVLFYLNVELAFLALAITPVMAVIALAYRRVARDSGRGTQRAQAQVNAGIQEAISGIGVTKSFRREGQLYTEFAKVNQRFYTVNVRQGMLYSGVLPLLIVVTEVGSTIAIYFGGLDVLNHTVSAGTWFLFVQSIWFFWVPLTSIAAFWGQFQLGLAASERIFALIDAEPRVQQTDSRPVASVAGRIEFRDLDFHYTDQETVLHGFNLTIKAGETVALVGHTGAGKSTLGKLVARFYEFQDGSLLIDGQDIRSLELASYRAHVGVVPQAPFLFSGTVAENIRYARAEATDWEVQEAARHIGNGDWIEALPDGLDTVVGEAGRSLSMGQRQLIALARVLLRNPSIIILDEATASVDPLTETQIQEGLDLVLRNRTAIIIAHRLSTVMFADRILVLRRGQVVEEGNHEVLMHRGGHYANLYNTYFRHQSPDYDPGQGFVPVLTTELN
jgi:ABC-type multidrug transport system fused ATPase/permease subunit